MRAIIWKEIRENFKWAILWMLGVAAAIVYALAPEARNSYSWQGISSLCSSNFLVVMTFGSAAGGALLGLLQMVSEVRRDQWAFLIHRPTTRTKILFGKILGGLILYLPAMGLPLFGAALWAATPGHFAGPFDWRMVLPGIADILVGVVFYFAGMLTGIRQARWYGSRALGIVAAIPCAVIIGNVPEFWQALLVIAAFGALLSTAAWGSFLTAGEYRPQPRTARASLGITLFAGMVAIAVASAGIASSLLRDPFSTWTRYLIDKEGTILRVAEDYGEITEIADLNGNVIEKYQDPKVRHALYQHIVRTSGLLSERTWPSTGYRSSHRFFSTMGGSGNVWWYYVVADQLIRGYSARDKRLIGSLGPDGFAPVGSENPPTFDGPCLRVRAGYDTTLAFPQVAYQVDFYGRCVTVAFSAAAGQEIIGACTVWKDGYFDTNLPSPIAIATREQIHILTEDGAPLHARRFDYDIEQYTGVEVAMLPSADRFFVWYRPSFKIASSKRSKMPDYIVELSSDGAELNRHELPPLYRPTREPWYDGLWAAAVPLVGAIGEVITSSIIVSMRDPTNAWGFAAVREELFRGSPQVLAVACTALLASAILCAVIVAVIARRYAFGRRQLRWWVAGGFLVGPAALLTLIALREWPARETCPACGKKRVVNRAECEHCGKEFALPVHDGTEIFDG